MNHCSDEIPLISSTIAITLAKNMTSDELNVYGNFLAAIGADMMTIAAAREASSNSASSSNNNLCMH